VYISYLKMYGGTIGYGSTAMLPAPEALQFVGGIPEGWKLKASREGFGYDY
jgi:hypothetical protein